jgi:hypothetical protein
VKQRNAVGTPEICGCSAAAVRGGVDEVLGEPIDRLTRLAPEHQRVAVRVKCELEGRMVAGLRLVTNRSRGAERSAGPVLRGNLEQPQTGLPLTETPQFCSLLARPQDADSKRR